VTVSVRDAREAESDREWIRSVYRDYISELSSSQTGVFPMLGEWDMRSEEFLGGWFSDPVAHPFVNLKDGARAGFALVARPPAFPRTSVAFRMAEFFVVEPSRRRGIGANAAALLFSRFAGDWEVLEDAHNRPALQFWRRVISRETAGRYSETRSGGEVRHRFSTAAHPSASGK
jgi:predicted acetyltransferase